ncbi:sensor histidine kinase [Sanguibacter sp. A247]|uniref:sensor histidine kinase n=1 Tax=unclassified Sanguibacter TaxID=2645534 RepID=UPI003FD715B7
MSDDFRPPWWQRLQQTWDRNALWIDVAGTALLLVLAIGLFGVSMLEGVYAILFLAPLALRRYRPTLSVVLVYSVGLFYTLTAPEPGANPAILAVLVALYSVTVHGPRWAYRTAMITGIAGAVLFSMMLWVTDGIGTPGAFMGIAFGAFSMVLAELAVWGFALTRRARKDMVAALIDRAERLEVERDQQARIATAAERTRIAREMHDIVAHSLSVIIAQADGGRYVVRHDPAAGERTLGTIADTGRDALADMRRLLGVLREPDGLRPPTSLPDVAAGATSPGSRAGSPPGDRAPQPASGDLEGLVAQVRATGLDVSFVRMGTPRTLPPGVGLAVYRVCQESLTNILKHAGPSPSVTVVLTWGIESLTLQVSDDGRGASAGGDGAGQGLLGMRERATMFGGTLTAGPRPGGGFRVHLTVPIPRGPAAAPPTPEEPS